MHRDVTVAEETCKILQSEEVVLEQRRLCCMGVVCRKYGRVGCVERTLSCDLPLLWNDDWKQRADQSMP